MNKACDFGYPNQDGIQKSPGLVYAWGNSKQKDGYRYTIYMKRTGKTEDKKGATGPGVLWAFAYVAS